MSAKFLKVCSLLLIILTASISKADWKKHENNPVLTPTAGEWDGTHTWTIGVIKDGGVYKAWYGGVRFTYAIGYATSTDGINWTKYSGNPVLELGADGDFDDGNIHSPCVIKDGSTYKMWYVGHDGTNDRIGYATSNNGTTWAKQGMVLDLGGGGEWDSTAVKHPWVIKDGSTYKMWYSGDAGSGDKIGYATSTDGINWDKYGDNPVFVKSGNGWEKDAVSNPSVVKDEGTYKMWYIGVPNLEIGYATSSDGINWVRGENNPVIEKGSPGSWDDTQILFPCVLKGSWKMWYTGVNGSGSFRIGYAALSEGRGRKGYVYRGYYVLDAFGGIHLCDGAPAVKDYPYWEGQDLARDLEFSPGGVGFYVLDAYGGIHPCDGAPTLEGYPYWDNQDIARDIEFNPNGPGFYVLDCYGGIHACGGAGELHNYPYWPDEDIARGLEIRSDGSFYIIDRYGGIHPCNGAPEIENYPYWDDETAMARDLEIDPRLPETGYFVLDNWGGIHAIAAKPLEGYPYWEGQDLARAIAFPR